MTRSLPALFDASCMVGQAGVRQPGAPTTALEMREILDAVGITSAVVLHADAARYSVAAGNARLLTEIADVAGLYPCWVLLPHQTGEVAHPDEEVAAMLTAGVRAARLFPRDHGFAFRRWNLDVLLERLAAHELPVWVDFGDTSWSQDGIDWEGVDEVCAAFPTLPVVLVRPNIGTNRRLLPLMERRPNLLIETSYYTVHRGIELLCRTFGARRILFGTGIPDRAPGPAITALTYSLIGDDERALIGGGNLRALLDGVTP